MYFFLQSFSYGGTVNVSPDDKNLSTMSKVKDRKISIKFNADHSSSLKWNFHPRQSEIIVYTSPNRIIL